MKKHPPYILSANRGPLVSLAVITFSFAVGCVNTSGSVGDVHLSNQDSLVVQPSAEASGITDTISIYSEDGTLRRKLTYQIDPDDTLPIPKYLNHIKGYSENDTIYGEFNGDGRRDTAWMVADTDNYFRCEDSQDEKACRGNIKFSDKAIPPLVIDYCPFGFPKNEGDLNEDGGDEIGILPGWFNSSCRSYQVFTLKGNRWVEACAPIENSLNMREAGVVLIEKDPALKGFAIVRSSYEESQWCSCQRCSVVERTVKIR